MDEIEGDDNHQGDYDTSTTIYFVLMMMVMVMMVMMVMMAMMVFMVMTVMMVFLIYRESVSTPTPSRLSLDASPSKLPKEES